MIGRRGVSRLPGAPYGSGISPSIPQRGRRETPGVGDPAACWLPRRILRPPATRLRFHSSRAIGCLGFGDAPRRVGRLVGLHPLTVTTTMSASSRAATNSSQPSLNVCIPRLLCGGNSPPATFVRCSRRLAIPPPAPARASGAGNGLHRDPAKG